MKAIYKWNSQRQKQRSLTSEEQRLNKCKNIEVYKETIWEIKLQNYKMKQFLVTNEANESNKLSENDKDKDE